MCVQTLHYDVIGLGFGPANLAIAIALEEDPSVRREDLDYCFIEKQEAFEWHGGMLLDDTHMQVSFLKDLATLRNPASRFTFINYLHERRRLDSFINLGTFFPSRLEYNDYMRWAAGHFQDRVFYGEQATSVEPVQEHGRVAWLCVTTRRADGSEEKRYARNLVIGIGGYPRVPEAFDGFDHPRVIHSSHYRNFRQRFDEAGEAPRLAVVGAGQSAAEIFNDLMDRYPRGQVDLISRGRALQPSDDSPFVNEIFDPDFTDEIYTIPDQQRSELLNSFRQTNYSVVDLPLIERLYERLYLQKITGEVRHRYLSGRHLRRAEHRGDSVAVELASCQGGAGAWHEYDGVVLATGYHRDGHRRLLSPLSPWIADGPVERHYRLPLSRACDVNVFLQGCCEETHGISDSLLSVLAVRSKEVVDELLTPAPLSAARAG